MKLAGVKEDLGPLAPIKSYSHPKRRIPPHVFAFLRQIAESDEFDNSYGGSWNTT